VGDAISGGLAKDPKICLALENSEKAKLLSTEKVSVKSFDGLNLMGEWYPAEDPKRIVIAMHGWRSSWQLDYGTSIDFLHDNGCSILLANQRSHNESDGEYIGFGVFERFDCLEWINYLINRFGKDIPIYLLGVSMGATTVLMASGFVLPASVHGIIADCGFTSPKAIWSYVAGSNLHLSEKLVYPIANAITKAKAKYDGEDCTTTDALSHNTVPVLFVHGTNDKFVPIQMTFENYTACKAPKELLVVPGAGHGFSYLEDTKLYQKTVLEFFRSYDK
jgi:fermentation-respiration switch protein FrsA (DUF1100 family)